MCVWKCFFASVGGRRCWSSMTDGRSDGPWRYICTSRSWSAGLKPAREGGKGRRRSRQHVVSEHVAKRHAKRGRTRPRRSLGLAGLPAGRGKLTRCFTVSLRNTAVRLVISPDVNSRVWSLIRLL